MHFNNSRWIWWVGSKELTMKTWRAVWKLYVSKLRIIATEADSFLWFLVPSFSFCRCLVSHSLHSLTSTKLNKSEKLWYACKHINLNQLVKLKERIHIKNSIININHNFPHENRKLNFSLNFLERIFVEFFERHITFNQAWSINININFPPRDGWKISKIIFSFLFTFFHI